MPHSNQRIVSTLAKRAVFSASGALTQASTACLSAADERGAVHDATERLQLTPVMFELGARLHPPRDLYRAYLERSHIASIGNATVGSPPGETVSGLEDEYFLSDGMPRLLYVKAPADEREPRLGQLLKRIQRTVTFRCSASMCSSQSRR